MSDRYAMQPSIRSAADGQALVDLRERALDPLAQVGEAVADALDVGDEVLVAVRAEHGALGRTQPAQPDREHDREEQRDQRHGRRRRARRFPSSR